MSKRNRYGRKKSADFGAHLKRWRKEKGLTLNKAAILLGLTMKNPGAYLSMIETGVRPIPDMILQNVPKIYGRQPEEVIEKVYYPQLFFPILGAVSNIGIKKGELDRYLEKVEIQLDEKAKRELIQFVKFLLFRKHTSTVK